MVIDRKSVLYANDTHHISCKQLRGVYRTPLSDRYGVCGLPALTLSRAHAF